MPTERKSLTTDLESRYKTQRVGSAYDVKKTLKQPGASPQSGERMPINGNEQLVSVNDFAVKAILGKTEFLDALDSNLSMAPKSKEMSRHMAGFSNRKYKP